MPTEEQVAAAAAVIADSPMIDTPKLPAENWYGLARACLEASEEIGRTSPGVRPRSLRGTKAL